MDFRVHDGVGIAPTIEQQVVKVLSLATHPPGVAGFG
jgi:hypothetical protein